MNLIPLPKSAQEKQGVIKLGGQTVVNGDFPKSAELLIELLKNFDGGEDTGVAFVKDNSLSEEGYQITCGERDAVVKAATDKGAFYAFVTLRQMLGGGNALARAEIKDEPKYSYRGFMLDCARHFWSTDKIKQLLDVMADLKMNEFHWHLSEDQGWRAEIKKYPLLTQKGTTRRSEKLYRWDADTSGIADDKYGEGLFYTQDEMRDIVAYAGARHIEVVPEIDMPGHMLAAIACYPNLSCTGKETEVSSKYGVTDNICCAGKDDIYDFAKDVLDELCEIFPGRFFHIGGDEAPKSQWKVCPNCQKKIKQLSLKDENALQGYFNAQIADYLAGKGKRMIGWNEILDARKLLNKDTVAQWWVAHSRGNKNEKEWMREGGKCIMSMCKFVYMDHSFSIRPLSKTYSFSPQKLGLKDDSNVLGMEIPQWTEFIADGEKLDMLTYARLVAFSEVCWKDAQERDYAEFETRMENMRPYFSRLGCEICPQEFYRGKVRPRYILTYAAKWAHWNKYPDYEYDMLKKSKDGE